MKKIFNKLLLMGIALVSFNACKNEVYTEELQFIVVDEYSGKAIPNATVQLIKVWRHPTKISDNAEKGDWFPSYGRKHMTEMQTGITDEHGIVLFTQTHKKYLYILPGAKADGYQMPHLDTLNSNKKNKLNGLPYKIEMRPMVKTTFIFKSQMPGNASDSVVFSSCEQIKVMKGASIDDKMVVYTSNSTEPYTKIWYGGIVYRKGKKTTLCNYVVSYPQINNECLINIDM